MDVITFTSDELTPTDVGAALLGADFQVGPTRRVRRTLLDTLDGRLRAAGLRLELREQARRGLVLTGTGSPPARVTVDGSPRLARNLPVGPFRSRLAGVLDIRALLPMLSVTAREASAQRTDAAGKARVNVVHL